MVPVGENEVLPTFEALLGLSAVVLLWLVVALWVRRRRRASGKYETTMFTTLLSIWAARLVLVCLALGWLVTGYQALRAWPADQVTSQVWEYSGGLTITDWSSDTPELVTDDGVPVPVRYVPGIEFTKSIEKQRAMVGLTVEATVRCRAWHGWWPGQAEYVLADCDAGPATSTGISMIIEKDGSE